jgi:DNA-binding NtrC family response regulator
MPSAIVVDQDLPTALMVLSVLTANEFHVTTSASYLAAKQCVTSRAPDLLITGLALGEYNGLGLVLRGKSHNPNMAAVVISTLIDPVLQADAEAMGATFFGAPVTESELKAAVFRTLFRQADAGPIRPPFERRLEQRRQLLFLSEEDRRRIAERRGHAPKSPVILPSLVQAN